MIDLTKKVLPTSVEVGGIYFKIKTDFRAWIRFSQIAEEEGSVLSDVDWLYTDKVPEDRKAGFNALMAFYSPKRELPRSTGNEKPLRIIDYELDGDMIFSAFYEQYRIDLVEADLHWHKFLALLDGLHDTKFNEVLSYRSYEKSNKSYDAFMQELKTAWELPDRLTKKQQDAKDQFKMLFA